jgi:polyhydroxybutyrate depolymerase
MGPRRLPAAAVLMAAALILSGCRAAGPINAGPASPGPDVATATTVRPPGTSSGQLTFGGRDRTYLVHVPAVHPAHPALVVSLHGSLGDGAAQSRLTGFDALSDHDGFVVAYPDGVDRSWADGRGADPAERQGVDDVGFLAALIITLERDDGVDPRRVYLTGMSNGAFMTQRFACERPELVAAIAPVAGTLGGDVPCHPSRPVAVLEVHGTADPVVPYQGGRMTGRGGGSTILSAPQASALWRAVDGCRAAPVVGVPRPGSDGTSVTVTRTVGCRDATAVELWTVTGGGHTWPGGPQYLPVPLVGRASDAFDASAAIWDFFAAHPSVAGAADPLTGPADPLP